MLHHGWPCIFLPGSNHEQPKSNSSTTKKRRERKSSRIVLCVDSAIGRKWCWLVTTIISIGSRKAQAILLAHAYLNLSDLGRKRKQQSSFTSSHIVGDPHSKNQQYITRVLIQHGRCTVPSRGVLHICYDHSGAEVSVKMPVDCSRCKIRPLFIAACSPSWKCHHPLNDCQIRAKRCNLVAWWHHLLIIITKLSQLSRWFWMIFSLVPDKVSIPS